MAGTEVAWIAGKPFLVAEIGVKAWVLKDITSLDLPARSRRGASVSGSPAHAGIDRKQDATISKAKWFPRPRGDTPCQRTTFRVHHRPIGPEDQKQQAQGPEEEQAQPTKEPSQAAGSKATQAQTGNAPG